MFCAVERGDVLKHGLVVGKFYPPHNGHHHLIDTALAECDQVTVVLMYSKVESIPYLIRRDILREMHPSAVIVTAEDNSPVEYTDETWELFLDALLKAIGFLANKPNIIYTGEDYAPEFAQRLWHRYQDRKVLGEIVPDEVTYRKVERKGPDAAFPNISGTGSRDSMVENWENLAPPTKAYFARRIVVCGPESSGTTTLSKDLAAHYKTACVPEMGRHYDWGVGHEHQWKTEDFTIIADEQKRWEDIMARESHNGVLICDTDEFATMMFHEVYLDEKAPHELVKKAFATPADLYIITSHHGVPFEDDGTRRDSGKRSWEWSWLYDRLPWGPSEDKDVGILLLSGGREKRLSDAIANIDAILKWDISTPIEYRKNYRDCDCTTGEKTRYNCWTCTKDGHPVS